MDDIMIYNTLRRKKEVFRPINDKKIKMYVCGPTVYDYLHIGNARPYVVFDTVRRYLEYKGYEVCFVQNYTDIDDKIINKAIEKEVDVRDISEMFIKEAQEDAEKLNIKKSSFNPRVTEEIGAILDMISEIELKGYAYVNKGTVYFDTSKKIDYGKLSDKNIEELIEGQRVSKDEFKKNKADFILWKPSKSAEPRFESVWGPGRPGWHIECSAMAKKYLGDTIDIHAGGEDLVFPHHENEIAQSEVANDVDFARYWMHNGFINIDNKKMSKSKGNFFSIRSISKDFDYSVIRFFILSSHYRKPLNFSYEALTSAANAIKRIKICKHSLDYAIEECTRDGYDDKAELIKFWKSFNKSMNDDFNTAQAVSVIFELVRFINLKRHVFSKTFAQETLNMLNELLSVLGLEFEFLENKDSEDDAYIEEIIKKRAKAREEGDYILADQIRDELSKRNVILEDSKHGVRWRYK